MGYSKNPENVRVDFFRSSGQWYATEAVRWTGAYFASDKGFGGDRFQLIHDAFLTSLRDHFGDRPRLLGMWAVCLEPYHEHAYPLMLKWEG